MGSFYTNITVSGPSDADVISFLTETGRRAYVSPTHRGFTVIYDEACEAQDTDVLSVLAEELSAKFDCPALAVLNHDDGVLFYRLFISGVLRDEYVSAPDAFDMDEEDVAEVAGDAALLCEIFGVEGKEDRVREILADRTKYKFEYERHGQLLSALGLPQVAVGLGYDSIAATKQPERIQAVGLVHVGEKTVK